MKKTFKKTEEGVMNCWKVLVEQTGLPEALLKKELKKLKGIDGAPFETWGMDEIRQAVAAYLIENRLDMEEVEALKRLPN